MLLFSCKPSSEKTFPQISKTYSFFDTLGKTYFVFKTYIDPGKPSDDETNEYLVFCIDQGQTNFTFQDSSLETIKCTYSEFHFIRIINLCDTTKTYLNKGNISGKKLNNETWEISTDVQTALEKKTIAFKEIFNKSKQCLIINDMGQVETH